MTKILYVPLDDRDCNYEFPWLLSKMTEDIELLRPPYEWMGFLKTPANAIKYGNGFLNRHLFVNMQFYPLIH